LRGKAPKNLDQIFEDLHQEAFDRIDCLDCGNCCKTTSPVFTDIDIARIAKYLKIRPAELVSKHLHLDKDNDYVLNTAPCTFLDQDNQCGIYSVRPKACQEYPHTNRRKMIQLLPLTLENTKVCPAVFEIVEKLKTIINVEVDPSRR
jgi:Fe-S-cluster containining protein